MHSKREQDRIQALKKLEEKFIADQLADLLYHQRRRAGSLIGSGLLDVLFYLGDAMQAATAPSREQIREQIQRGLLDDVVARRRFMIQFNNFINDLSNEEKDRLIASHAPITETVNYYVARNSHIALCDSLMNQYQQEEKSSIGQDKRVVQQNISAVQAIRKATNELPKILPTATQLQRVTNSVTSHRGVLENNRPSDAKILAAIAFGSFMVPFLAPFIALASIAITLQSKKVAESIAKTRFFTDVMTSDLPSQTAKLIKLGNKGRK